MYVKDILGRRMIASLFIKDSGMADADPIWSGMASWETVTALCRSRFPVERTRRGVAQVAAARPIRLVAIGVNEPELALDACRTYGKDRNPAAFDMGGCFAYACTKANGAQLLDKGNDFARTDFA